MPITTQNQFIRAIKDYILNKIPKPHFEYVAFNLDSEFFYVKKINGILNFYEDFKDINEYSTISEKQDSNEYSTISEKQDSKDINENIDEYFDYYIINDDDEFLNSNIYNAKFHFSNKFVKYGRIDVYISDSLICKIMTKEEYEKLNEDKEIQNKYSKKFIIIYDEIDNLDNFKYLEYIAGFDVKKCKNIGDYWSIDNKKFIVRNIN